MGGKLDTYPKQFMNMFFTRTPSEPSRHWYIAGVPSSSGGIFAEFSVPFIRMNKRKDMPLIYHPGSAFYWADFDHFIKAVTKCHNLAWSAIRAHKKITHLDLFNRLDCAVVHENTLPSTMAACG